MTRNDAQRWLDLQEVRFVFQYTNPTKPEEFRILTLVTSTSNCKQLMDDMKTAGMNVDEVYPDYSEDGSERFLGWNIEEVINAEAENEADRKAVNSWADRLLRALRGSDKP